MFNPWFCDTPGIAMTAYTARINCGMAIRSEAVESADRFQVMFIILSIGNLSLTLDVWISHFQACSVLHCMCTQISFVLWPIRLQWCNSVLWGADAVCEKWRSCYETWILSGHEQVCIMGYLATQMYSSYTEKRETRSNNSKKSVTDELCKPSAACSQWSNTINMSETEIYFF